MAAKKTETKAETKTETKTTKNVEEELVKVIIPEDFGNPDDANFYCGVNGTAMFIPKGVEVEVPRKYAEVVKLTLAMRRDKALKAKADKAKADGIVNTTY